MRRRAGACSCRGKREMENGRAVLAHAANALPLVVLDDPQTTTAGCHSDRVGKADEWSESHRQMRVCVRYTRLAALARYDREWRRLCGRGEPCSPAETGAVQTGCRGRQPLRIPNRCVVGTGLPDGPQIHCATPISLKMPFFGNYLSKKPRMQSNI